MQVAHCFFDITHSLGTQVAMNTQADYEKDISGLYAMSAYRLYEDVFSSRIIEKSIARFITESDFGPAMKIRVNFQADYPLKFAIAMNDYVLNMHNSETRERFKEQFTWYGGEVEIFPGMNHCFRNRPDSFSPFNEKEPYLLVDSVKEFCYRNSAS